MIVTTYQTPPSTDRINELQDKLISLLDDYKDVPVLVMHGLHTLSSEPLDLSQLPNDSTVGILTGNIFQNPVGDALVAHPSHKLRDNSFRAIGTEGEE